MQQQIGIDHVGMESPPFCWVAMAVGVTRVSCRSAVPQTAGYAAGVWRSTTMTSGRSSDVSLESQAEFPVPVKRSSGRAPIAKALHVFAISTVLYRRTDPTWVRLSGSICRVVRCIVVGRPGRIYRERTSWTSIWRGDLRDETTSGCWSSHRTHTQCVSRDAIRRSADYCRSLARWHSPGISRISCSETPRLPIVSAFISQAAPRSNPVIRCSFVASTESFQRVPELAIERGAWTIMRCGSTSPRRLAMAFADQVVFLAARAFRDGWRARMWPVVSDEVRYTLVAGAVIDAIRTATQGDVRHPIESVDVLDLRARLLSRLESGVLGVQLMTDARRSELGRMPEDPEADTDRRISMAGADLALSESQESCRLRGELAQLSGENARILGMHAQFVRALSEIGQTPEAIEAERYQRLEYDRRIAWGAWLTHHTAESGDIGDDMTRGAS